MSQARLSFGAENSCTPIRLDVPPGSMSNVPVLAQGSMGDCYAIAAAQLVDAYRFSHGDKRTHLHTSHLMAAVDYARSGLIKFDDIGGGNICPCFNSIKARGACDSTALRGRPGYSLEGAMANYTYWQSNAAEDDTLKNRIRDFYNRLRGIPSKFEENLRKESREVAESICRDMEEAGLDLKKLPSLDALEEVIRQDNHAVLMEFLGKPFCSGENHFSVKVPACHDKGLGAIHPTPAKSISVVHSRLNQPNAQPIAISYCSNVLTDGKNYDGNALKAGAFKLYPLAAPDCYGHASLIIGRRPNPKTGKCEFLVRNSWGTSCDGYSKDWDCDNGNIWVDAESLSRNTFFYTYLE